jgi:hypothetical protein
LQRQPGPQRLPDVSAAAETAGGLTGSERFLRESRRPGEFVGADQSNTRFVGSGAIIETGRVRSAVESLPPPPDLAQQINRPYAPAGATQPYAPRIQVAFTPAAAPATNFDSLPSTETQLALLLARTGNPTLQVSVNQRTALLQGTATDDHQKALAELLVSFQPGISQVVNQIQVAADRP